MSTSAEPFVDLVDGDMESSNHTNSTVSASASSSTGNPTNSSVPSSSSSSMNFFAAQSSSSSAASSSANDNSFCRQRLRQERKQWKRSHPVGFVAKPRTKPDGSVDLMTWDCKIPGKTGTPWEGASYNLIMHFDEDFPAKPPKCVFKPVLFHPNVYPSGTVCLSILAHGWSPSLNIPSILEGIQELLNSPNLNDPAQPEPYKMLRDNPKKYEQTVRNLALKYGQSNN